MNEPDFVDEYYADKDLLLLKKLTLVIPTYNRNFYLSRCLWYHAHFPFGQIIVADSSPEEKKVVNRDTVAKTREMFGVNILYLEYEPEIEKYGGDIYRKWGDAVRHVETEYTLIVTDKEFVVPETAVECIQYLTVHHDYSLADARHYNIEKTAQETFCYTSIPTVTRTEVDSWERFLKMVEEPGCTLLSLHRTQIIKQEYESLLIHEVNDIRFGELYLELQSILLGKAMTYGDRILICRDVVSFENKHGIDKRKESSSFRYPQLWEYNASEKDRYYSHFKNGIVSRIEETSEMQYDVTSTNFDNLLQGYVAKRLGTDHLLRKSRAINMIFYHLPKKVQRWLLITFMGNACGISDYSSKELNITSDVDVILRIITHKEVAIIENNGASDNA